MARKTIDVAHVVAQANLLLSRPNVAGHISREFRLGVIAMVERMLHDTGNYKGFGYLSSELVTPDEPHVPNTTYLRVGYDETRRAYR